MTSLESALRRACADLETTGVDFALTGGLAVSARTEPRFTRVADVVVAVADDRAAEALVYALQGLGYGIGALVEQEAAARLATVRPTVEEDPDSAVVDLLFASSGIEAEIVEAAECAWPRPRRSNAPARLSTGSRSGGITAAGTSTTSFDP